MATNEDLPQVADIKKCKYCKSGVEKAGVKCANCAAYFHQSCALRITGLQVASGSKSLVLCGACSKKAREDEINSAVTERNEEIITLKERIIMLESEPNQISFAEVYKRMEAMQNLILEKISLLEAKVNNNKSSAVKKAMLPTLPTATTSKQQEQIEPTPASETNTTATSSTSPANYATVAGTAINFDTEKAGDDEAETFRQQKKRGWNRNLNLASDPSKIVDNNKPDQNKNWNELLRKKKSQRKVGTNNEFGDFEADKAPNKNKKIWLFITRVKNTITENIIQSYISKKSNLKTEDIEVKQCQAKNMNATFNCYMVGVHPDVKDIVYGESFWPAGVGFQRFDFSLGRNFLDKRQSQLNTS